MRNHVFLLSVFLLISCGGESSKFAPVAKVDDEIVVAFLEKELQSNTESMIEITNTKSLGGAENIQLSVKSINDEPNIDYLLTYEVVALENKVLINFTLSRETPTLERGESLTLELKLNEASDVIEYEVFIWGLPEIAELNMPQRGLLVSDKTIDGMGEEGKVYFYWVNLPPWTPPTNPNWEEDPYGNISWKLYYHSLGWLTAYVELYERTNNEKVKASIQRYLNDYDSTFADPFNTHIALAYREDAVSVRVNHLLYIYLKLYRDLPKNERIVIERLIEKDIQLLQVYLEQEVWDDKNHGLIQARSALNLVAVFPLHPDIAKLESSAHRRITALSEQLFSSEGYVIEQATGYHFIGISMMLEAKQQLDTFGMESNESLMSKIEKALIIAPYLLYHNGTTPAIGDTSYGKNWHGYLKRYYTEYGKPINELDLYLESRHAELDDLKVIVDEGVVIAKYIPRDEKMSKVFFDIGKARLIHGHYDHLNLVASLAGEPFLVDSGGPYTYSKVGGRDRWRYRSAHNTLVGEEEEIGDFPASIVSSYNDENLVSTSGSAQLNNDLKHHRGFVLTKEQHPLLIVVDSVEQSADKKLIEEYWHFAPQTTVESINEKYNVLTVESGKSFHHYKLFNSSESCEVLEGVVDENSIPLIGWVTPKYNKLESAPVAKCSTNNAQYIKVNIFTEQMIDIAPTFVQTESEIVIKIKDRNFYYSIEESQFIGLHNN